MLASVSGIGVPTGVIWSLSGHTSGGTVISTGGRLAVANDEAIGTFTVIAVSAYDPTKKATAKVTVIPSGSVTVSGTVADAPAGTRVEVYAASQTKAGAPGGYRYVDYTFTDGNRHYIFPDLPPGVYIVLVILNGRESEPGAPVSLTDGQTADNVNFEVKGDTVIPDESVTGVPELDVPDMKVYPNPFTGILHLTGADGCMLRVVNAAGVVVHTQKIVNPDETIRLEHLPAGVYFFRIEKDGKAKTVKAVKN
jgi:hypothetical protein